MSNAFASILQARPSPAFGRPVHLWGSPLDYGPVLLLMPFGFHLTVDTLPSRELQARLQVHLGCIRLSPSCPFRLLHTSRFLRPATYYCRYRVQRSSSERRGDLHPPDQCAAQRKLHPRGSHGRVGYPALPQPPGQFPQFPGSGPEFPDLLVGLRPPPGVSTHTARLPLCTSNPAQ